MVYIRGREPYREAELGNHETGILDGEEWYRKGPLEYNAWCVHIGLANPKVRILGLDLHFRSRVPL